MEISNDYGGCVDYLVRDIFDDFFNSDYENFDHSGRKRPEFAEQIANYQIALNEIENTEKKISDARVKHEERLKKILGNSRAEELIRLKRQPLYDNFETSLTEKYALLESDDLLPDYERRKNDFRINDLAKKRWRAKLSIKSDDSLFKTPDIHEKTEKMVDENFHPLTKSKDQQISLRSTDSFREKGKFRRSIVKTEQQKIVLVARPACVEFKNFKPRKIYKRSIILMNVSNSLAKFRLEPITTRSNFSFAIQSPSGDRENLAPGIHLKIIVHFFSDDADNYDERIVVRVQYGKDICVVLKAYRDPPILRGTCYRLMNYRKTEIDDEEEFSLTEICCDSCDKSDDNSWNFGEENLSISSNESLEIDRFYVETESLTIFDQPSFAQIECHKCFVGEQIIVVTRLKNVGGDGKFFVMTEIDWNSMCINDITTENLIILSCFAMWPVYFVLNRNEEMDLVTYFFPECHSFQVDKLYIVCDNLTVHPIELIGDGVMYDPSFIKIHKNEGENNDWSENREEDFFDYSVNLGFETTNGHVKDTITITNSSGIEIYYRWSKGWPSSIEGRDEFRNYEDLPLELLNIRPNNGIIPPCSSLKFKISVRLTNLNDDFYRAVLQLILIDVPLAAISMDYDNRIENCNDRRRLCETSMDVRDKEIEVRVRCTGFSSPESFNSSISHEAMEDCENLYEK